MTRDTQRTEDLRTVVRLVLGHEPTLRVDVLPLKFAHAHRVILRVQSDVSFTVADEMPANVAATAVRDAYVSLAEELRERLKLHLSSIGGK